METSTVVMATTFFLAGLVVCAFVAILRFVQRDAYRNLAQRRGGRVRFSGWLSGWYRPPVVRFMHDGQEVVVTCDREEWRSNYTELRIGWFDKDFCCLIRPTRFLDKFSSVFGRPNYRSGFATFDHRFTVAANDDEKTRQALSPHLQLHMLQFRTWNDLHRLTLRIEKGVVCVRKYHRYHTRENLRKFVASALTTYDLLSFTSLAGIELLETTDDSAREIVCQICGDQVTDNEAVYCRACRTPHHAECWKYAGKCSVYACGATRYSAAKPVG